MPQNSSNSELLVEKKTQYWVLTLNRPDKRNALSATLVEQLISTIDDAEQSQVPMLVFKGAGKNFSAGFDFTGFEEASEGDLLLRFVRIEVLLQKIAYSSCFTLALAHGANFGAGVDIIACCKYRVAAPESRFRMPGLKFGLVLGTGRLAELIGSEAARDLLETTRLFNVEEALKNGLITEQVVSDQWCDTINQCLQTATALPTYSRHCLYEKTTNQARADEDMAALARSAATPGIKERIRAFRNG